MQKNAPWGLASISSMRPGASDYIYDISAGEGTFTYVLDDGIRADHVNFQGRVTANSLGDCATKDSHGTVVASCIVGRTYGASKRAQAVPVRILSSTAQWPHRG